MSRHAAVVDALLSLQRRIISLEEGHTSLTETDTRQGLINPLFRALGWDFGDFDAVRSELRHRSFNEPVDYAFYSSKDQSRPILLLEAKRFGADLTSKTIVKQICGYMGEFGVQWGAVSDGNKYILYNSRGGDAFDDKKFLTIEIKKVDTEDGAPAADLAKRFVGLLSRECLENEEIQHAYEEHMKYQQIQRAMASLLSRPFDTLVDTIRGEFTQQRVRANPILEITKAEIEEYLNSIADEEGAIGVDLEADQVHADDEVITSAARTEVATAAGAHVRTYRRRILIADLLDAGLIREGDNWRFVCKGEVTWGRVVGNGQLEVNGRLYPNPSSAGRGLMRGQPQGWYYWQYKNANGAWRPIDDFRKLYRERHEDVAPR